MSPEITDRRGTVFPRGTDSELSAWQPQAKTAIPCNVPPQQDSTPNIEKPSTIAPITEKSLWKRRAGRNRLLKNANPRIKSPSPRIQSPPPKPHSPFLLHEEPWTRYRPFMEEADQAGAALIAHINDPTFNIVAVKTKRLTAAEKVSNLKKACHPNIVSLKKVYQSNMTLFLLYEAVDASHVSLAEIEDSPGDPMNEVEIAAVCWQILCGLSFIHKELRVVHGAINTKNVLLSKRGIVKIANVADGMLRATPGTELDDSRALGDMVGELIVGSSGPQIREFLEATKFSNTESLLKHVFLEFSPGSGCLVPHVRVAVRNRISAWRLIPAA
ncbi:hypothetical protein AJ80_09401 [Polytolypa hystricis UAMH7299]|uniref:Protein kinase domain-containing protein n=1 Tax=Polytolypa hystricis (strain UAMH7299) TaxID=1447883 RepID=A0A2B7WRL5_POLH7|nr:hypothetical protein AJ80_09401 [Polytolypa hystricis UAMH7299]